MNHFVLARFGMKLWKGRVRAPWLYGAVMTHTPKLCFITYCLVNSNSWKASYINQHVGRRATVYFSGGARGGGRGKEKEVQNACSRRTWNRMQKFPVHLRLGGTEHGGKAEFSSQIYYSVFQSMFLWLWLICIQSYATLRAVTDCLIDINNYMQSCVNKHSLLLSVEMTLLSFWLYLSLYKAGLLRVLIPCHYQQSIWAPTCSYQKESF